MMELAPRDIVARSIQTEIDEGRGFEGGYIHLDLCHLGRERILERLPGIRQICMDFGGIDPIDEPIPIQPGQHYSMGGIDTDMKGRSRVPNFYAVGECACISVHGANRLGGNSLLDTIVFGRLAAEDINAGKESLDFEPDKKVIQEHFKKEIERVGGLLDRKTGVPYHTIREELRKLFTEKVGIFRNHEDMFRAVRRIRELRERYREVICQTSLGPFNFELLNVLELESLLYLGEITARGALARTESRGSHFRTDYTERNDADWLKHTVAQLDGEEIKLSYKDVDISRYEPRERTY
jgi:succinate dehydrogenase / fumarate reductase flavoprotein subunit